MIITRNLATALIATVIAFSTLYIPQPMLPMLASSFAVSASSAGLLMTVAMLPLAFAPAIYGYFLQAVPARLMLIVALTLLALNQACFYIVDEYWQLIVLRLVQGMILPAIFTALMTYCATTAGPSSLRTTMGIYIGATILGGFGGRLLGGFFASAYDWRMAFVVVAILQLLPIFLLLRVPNDTDINFVRLDSKSLLRVLNEPNYRYLLLMLATVFFVFSGILNIVPFRLQELEPTATPLLISMLYLGYLVGVPVSFFSTTLSRQFNDGRMGLALGLVMHASGLVLLLFVAFKGLILVMFLLAAGFFLMHALLSGLANQLTVEHKGVVNGIYVSIYYFSGALGSWLPGFIYEGLAWNGLVITFLGILVVCAYCMFRFKASPYDPESTGARS